MSTTYPIRNAPGQVRDAILQIMSLTSQPLSVKQIEDRVGQVMGRIPTSSVRSYLRLNTPEIFVRESRGYYTVQRPTLTGRERELFSMAEWEEPAILGKAKLVHANCFDWLEQQDDIGMGTSSVTLEYRQK